MNDADREFVYSIIYDYTDEEFNYLIEKMDLDEVNKLFQMIKAFRQEKEQEEFDILEHEVEESNLVEANQVLNRFRLK